MSASFVRLASGGVINLGAIRRGRSGSGSAAFKRKAVPEKPAQVATSIPQIPPPPSEAHAEWTNERALQAETVGDFLARIAVEHGLPFPLERAFVGPWRRDIVAWRTFLIWRVVSAFREMSYMELAKRLHGMHHSTVFVHAKRQDSIFGTSVMRERSGWYRHKVSIAQEREAVRMLVRRVRVYASKARMSGVPAHRLGPLLTAVKHLEESAP